MIREASLADAVEYLSSRGVEIPSEIKCRAMVVNECLFVAYVPIDEITCEVHVCTKPNMVRQAKKSIKEAEHFLKFQGFDWLVTMIEPEYPLSIKLAERIGFNRAGCYNNKIVFVKGV